MASLKQSKQLVLLLPHFDLEKSTISEGSAARFIMQPCVTDAHELWLPISRCSLI